MGSRRALAVAGVVILALIAVLAWKARGGDDTPSPAPRTSTTVAEPAPAATTAAAPVPAPTVPEAAEPADLDEAAQPQPVPLAGSASPPPLDGKHSEPAPPQKQFTREETIAKREADLKLLDDTKARLEGELATARTQNPAAVHDLEIRIARLTDLRKKRGEELDKLRAGGSAQP